MFVPWKLLAVEIMKLAANAVELYKASMIIGG